MTMLIPILKQQQTHCVEFWHITPLKSISPQAEFLMHKKFISLRGGRHHFRTTSFADAEPRYGRVVSAVAAHCYDARRVGSRGDIYI